MESDRNAAILAEIFADSDSKMEIDTENDETTDDESSNDGDKAASSGTASVFAPVDHDEVQNAFVQNALSPNAFIVYMYYDSI